MKQIFTLILIALTLSTTGQVDDRTETNCDGESRSIYEIGDQGFPLIVASTAFDCNICIAVAGDVWDFADANQDVVAVWGAMTFLNPTPTPNCENVAEWNTTNSWGESIFTFADVDDYWFVGGTPKYYVIHPSTREVVYEGSNFSTASTTALGLSTTGVSDEVRNGNFRIYQGDRGIVVNKPSGLRGELRIFNIVGQEVFSAVLVGETDQRTLAFNTIDGIYIASFYSEGVQLSTKFIFKN
jgi:hypothetical protein